VSLVATSDPTDLNVGLTARSCNKSMIINGLIKKKKIKRKTNKKKKTNEEKEKKSKLTMLILQTRLTRQT